MGCGASAQQQAPAAGAGAPAPVPGPSEPAQSTHPASPATQPAEPLPDRTPAVSSTAQPPAEKSPEAQHPPVHANSARVLIHGIERKPELNGQVGIVVTFDGGPDRRYTVRVNGALVKLREDKLLPAPAEPEKANGGSGSVEAGEACVDVAMAQCMGIAPVAVPMNGTGASATTDVSRQQTSSGVVTAASGATLNRQGTAGLDGMPFGELTSTGALIPTYRWAQVPAVASLPPGMEVWMPVGGGKCARIPETWRLQIVAEGQIDSYRCDVGEHTPVIDVVIGAAARFGWEVHDLELLAMGTLLELEEEATVGSAGLFGQKLTARRMLTRAGSGASRDSAVPGASRSDMQAYKKLVKQQEAHLQDILAELKKNGRKTGHWIWYAFPTEKEGDADFEQTRVTKETAIALCQNESTKENWRAVLETCCDLIEGDLGKDVLFRIDHGRIYWFIRFWTQDVDSPEWMREVCSRLSKFEWPKF